MRSLRLRAFLSNGYYSNPCILLYRPHDKLTTSASDDGLEVHAETLRQRQRRRKPYRQRRERRAHFGELVPLDGSFHDWLEERGPRGCLMHLVEDATTTGLGRFTGEETTWAAPGVCVLGVARPYPARVPEPECPTTMLVRSCIIRGRSAGRSTTSKMSGMSPVIQRRTPFCISLQERSKLASIFCIVFSAH